MDRRSILIFRNGSIGNTLMAVPAIKCIRNSFSQARIHVVVDRVGFDLLEHCPYIDSLVIYEKRGADRGLGGFLSTVKKLRSLRPDYALLFKRFFRNGLLAYLSGAEIRAGFLSDGRAPFLNLTVPYDDRVHVVDLNLRLAELIGANVKSASDPEVFLADEDLKAVSKILSDYRLSEREYFVVHYGGATSGVTHVPPQLLADLLARIRGGKPILFVGAGNQESAMADTLAHLILGSSSVTNLPLRTTIALIKSCYGFIGMNSGPTHIAAACGVPGLALYRDDENFALESVKWAPRSKFMRVIPASERSNGVKLLALAEQAWSDVVILRAAS